MPDCSKKQRTEAHFDLKMSRNPRFEQPPAHVTLAADGVHARAAADGQRIELKPFNGRSSGNLHEV